MKKLIFISLILFVQTTFGQQDSTQILFSSKPIKVKFYGGTGFEISSLNQNAIYSSTVDLGLLFNKKLIIGIYSGDSFNSTNRIVLNNTPTNKDFLVYQAGIKVGYIFKPHKSIHLTASSKIGVLSVDYTKLLEDFKETYYLLPQVDAELNLTRHIRLNLGMGYRFANGSDIFFQQNQANSIIYHFGVSFGRFYK